MTNRGEFLTTDMVISILRLNGIDCGNCPVFTYLSMACTGHPTTKEMGAPTRPDDRQVLQQLQHDLRNALAVLEHIGGESAGASQRPAGG
jgi:hypothetical protein